MNLLHKFSASGDARNEFLQPNIDARGVLVDLAAAI
jgi:hypothetical protein